MSFSERFKELRIKKGLSQDQLADALNIPRTSISHYERDGRLPREERLVQIADFFGVTVDYLIGRTEDETELTNSEEEFVNELIKYDKQEISLEELLKILNENFDITTDGKPATEEEIKAAIAFIRSLRSLK